MLKDMEAMKGELTALAKVIEFHGYQRAGFGVNSQDGQQNCFSLPFAKAKYRLGNECEMYGEWELDANWINPDHDGAWFKTAFMWAFVTNRNGSFDNAVLQSSTGTLTSNGVAVRQAYVEAGHIIDGQPGMTFWAGQRYYRRRDIHINDYFYQNTSSFGGGFQDADLGFGKLAIAYMGGSNGDGAGPFNLGKLARNIFDIRLGIPIGDNALEIWLAPTLGAERQTDTPQNGIAGGLFFNSGKFMGGFNEASVEFGFAGSADLGGSDNGGGFLSSANKDGWQLRFVDRAAIQLTPDLSMMWGLVFNIDNSNGDGCYVPATGSTQACSGGNIWFSAGARPVYMFSKYFGVTAEVGLDVTKPEYADSLANKPTLWLLKTTGAIILRTGHAFFSRPELRIFATGAYWASDAKGQVGGPAFAGDTAGATFGIQAESWW